jgi:hypothetical protein
MLLSNMFVFLLSMVLEPLTEDFRIQSDSKASNGVIVSDTGA